MAAWPHTNLSKGSANAAICAKTVEKIFGTGNVLSLSQLLPEREVEAATSKCLLRRKCLSKGAQHCRGRKILEKLTQNYEMCQVVLSESCGAVRWGLIRHIARGKARKHRNGSSNSAFLV